MADGEGAIYRAFRWFAWFVGVVRGFMVTASCEGGLYVLLMCMGIGHGQYR